MPCNTAQTQTTHTKELQPLSISRFIAIAVAALTFAHLAAMPAPAQTAAGGDSRPLGELTGRWTVISLFEKTAQTPAGDITFDPTAGLIDGATACNFFRGEFTTAPGELTIKVAMMTRRACIGGAAEHERAFLEAMKKTGTHRIDADRLILAAADGTALAELVRTPDASLEGPRHKIVSYLKNNGLYSIRAETGATLTLNGGRIEGNTGCRPFTASYALDGESLSIRAVTPAPTVAPCDASVRDQDEGILAGLPAVTTYDTSRNLIRLLKEQGGAAVLWITPQLP